MSQAPGAQPSQPSVYHERQRLELCAVHALNNVLQQQLFSQEAADEICKRLAPDSRLNPHRSLLGTGNYDVNVIMAALQGLGLAAVWWDRRRPLSQLALPQVLGLILNLPSPVSLGLLSLPLRRRHWVALRQVDGVYYNLDSKLRAPEALGDEDGVRAFLAAALAQGLCEVLARPQCPRLSCPGPSWRLRWPRACVRCWPGLSVPVSPAQGLPGGCASPGPV
ncbi:josephin-2 isoform X4 [Microcebus murinus]